MIIPHALSQDTEIHRHFVKHKEEDLSKIFLFVFYKNLPHSGRLNATYASPDLVPIFPPPQAITTYCLPSTAYVLGVAYPPAGRSVSYTTSPVSLSIARKFSSWLSAIKINPPAVTTGPP